jgi:hypothetical protein
MIQAFKNINAQEYRLVMNEEEAYCEVVISKNTEAAKEYNVQILKEQYFGSNFGTCTCGVPAKKGIPCKHMMAILKSSLIPRSTHTNIMPYFWSTAHWERQYAQEQLFRTDISIATIKAAYVTNKCQYYCPDWRVGGKKGCLKEDWRKITAMDHIEASAKKKRKQTNKNASNDN